MPISCKLSYRLEGMCPSGKHLLINDIHPELKAGKYGTGVYFSKSYKNNEKTNEQR